MVTTTRLAAGMSVILLFLAGSLLADVAPSRADHGGRADRSRRLVFRRDTCPGDPGDGKQCNSTSLQRSLTRTDKDYDSGTYVGNNSMCLKLMKPSSLEGLAHLTRKDQRTQSKVTTRRSLSSENLRRTDEVRDGRRRVTATRSVERTTTRVADRRSADNKRHMTENEIRRRVVDHTERSTLRLQTRRVTRSERDVRLVLQADRRRERSPSDASSTRRSDERARSPVEFRRTKERRDASVAQERTRLERRVFSVERRDSDSFRIERRISSVERRTSSPDSIRSQQSSRIERRISASQRRMPSPDSLRYHQSSRSERSVSSSDRRTASPDSVISRQASRIERRDSTSDRRTPDSVRSKRIERSVSSSDRRTASADSVRSRQASRIERRDSASDTRTPDSVRSTRASRIGRRDSASDRRTATPDSVRSRQTSRFERRDSSSDRRAPDSVRSTQSSRIERRDSASDRRTPDSVRSQRFERSVSFVERRTEESSRVGRRSVSTDASTRRSDLNRQSARVERRVASVEESRTRAERRALPAERRAENSRERATRTERQLVSTARQERQVVSVERRQSTERRVSSASRLPTDTARTRQLSRTTRSVDRVLSLAESTRRSSRIEERRLDGARASRVERRVSSAEVRTDAARRMRQSSRISSAERRTTSPAQAERNVQVSISDQRRLLSKRRTSESTNSRRTQERFDASRTERRASSADGRIQSRLDRRDSYMSDRRLKRSVSVESLSRRSSTTRRLKGDTEKREVLATNSQRRLGVERRMMALDISRRSAEESVAYRRSERNEESSRHGPETRSVRTRRTSDSTRQIRRVVSGEQFSSLQRRSSGDKVNERSLRRVVRVDGYDTLRRSSLNGQKTVENNDKQERIIVRDTPRSTVRESLYRRMVNILPHDDTRRQQETRNMRRMSASTRRHQEDRSLQRKSTVEARERREVMIRKSPLTNELQTRERRTKAHATMRNVERESPERKSRTTRETTAAARARERRETSRKVRVSDVSRRTDMAATQRQTHEDQRRLSERVVSTRAASETRGLITDGRNSRVDATRRRMALDNVMSQEARQQRLVGHVLQRRSSDVSSAETTRVRRSASETRSLTRSSRVMVDTVETIRTVRSSSLERQTKLATSPDHSARRSVSVTAESDGLRRHDSLTRRRSSERSLQATTTMRRTPEDETRRHVDLLGARSRRESRLASKADQMVRVSAANDVLSRARSLDGRRVSDKDRSYRHEGSIRGSRSVQRNFRALMSPSSTSQTRIAKEDSRIDDQTRRLEGSRHSHATIVINNKKDDFKTEENQLSVAAFARPDLKDNDVPDNYVSYVFAAILIGATIFYDSLVNSSLEASMPDWCGLERNKEFLPPVQDKLSTSKMELAGKRGSPGSFGSILAGVSSAHLF